LIDELMGAFIGGSLPTLRSRWNQGPADEKHTPSFFFQCLRPDAISGESFAQKRTQNQNVKAVIGDILGYGNEKCLLPGQPEAEAAQLSDKLGGLLFTAEEIDAFAEIAKEAGTTLDRAALRTATI